MGIDGRNRVVRVVPDANKGQDQDRDGYAKAGDRGDGLCG